ncbi:MAG: PfkB family carbohydrate kinase [Verrucomicrobia bacterium]|nr:PfkB family carbohydrate kinase [Verrucomicrobiota bacterium]
MNLESPENSVRPKFDVLGLGCIAVDELIYTDNYPPPDAKVWVSRTERQCGGLTATALVAASRFGAECAYAGVAGTDELSNYALSRLAAEAINLDYTRRKQDARVVHSFIVVDSTRGTRNIFADVNGAGGADLDWPDDDLIRDSRVLFVDQFGLPGMIRAAKIAREAGRPVVADIENDSDPRFLELFNLADHLIASEDFARRFTGMSDPTASAGKLKAGERQTVVVTAGERGCWYSGIETNGELVHQPAFEIEAVDTTGCGDVFHGAYAAALARQMGLRERILIASAAAALKAMQPGGQAGIPNRKEIDRFLHEREKWVRQQRV